MRHAQAEVNAAVSEYLKVDTNRAMRRFMNPFGSHDSSDFRSILRRVLPHLLRVDAVPIQGQRAAYPGSFVFPCFLLVAFCFSFLYFSSRFFPPTVDSDG